MAFFMLLPAAFFCGFGLGFGYYIARDLHHLITKKIDY
jgi:hypothetical protein